MVKRYEFEKAKFVIFTDDELKALEEGSRQTIAIVSFIPEHGVDPIYYKKRISSRPTSAVPNPTTCCVVPCATRVAAPWPSGPSGPRNTSSRSAPLKVASDSAMPTQAAADEATAAHAAISRPSRPEAGIFMPLQGRRRTAAPGKTPRRTDASKAPDNETSCGYGPGKQRAGSTRPRTQGHRLVEQCRATRLNVRAP
jgi:hypothetical protein